MHVFEDELQVEVVARETKAASVVSFRLAALNGELPEWSPGAHIGVVTPSGHSRQYSLTGSRQEDTWQIAVLRHDEGRGGSASMHHDLRVGTVLTVTAPRNNFPFDANGTCTFVAGGIGITPLIPMIEAAETVSADWQLIYIGRSRETMAYVDELESRYPGRIRIWSVEELGRPRLEEVLAERSGAVFCCGPQSMLDDITLLGEARRDIDVAIEHFEGVNVDSTDDKPFEIFLNRRGLALEVGATESILDVLQKEGVGVLSSCREGTCGTCETEVLEGEIEHRDVILNDEDREAGDVMMVCVSRAACSRLVLDL